MASPDIERMLSNVDPEIRKRVDEFTQKILLGLESFDEGLTDEALNLIILAKAAYEHGFHRYINKGKFLEWVSRMYDGGEKQKRIMRGECHGNININSSDITGAASYLELWGVKNGYLSRDSRDVQGEKDNS